PASARPLRVAPPGSRHAPVAALVRRGGSPLPGGGRGDRLLRRSTCDPGRRGGTGRRSCLPSPRRRGTGERRARLPVRTGSRRPLVSGGPARSSGEGRARPGRAGVARRGSRCACSAAYGLTPATRTNVRDTDAAPRTGSVRRIPLTVLRAADRALLS